MHTVKTILFITTVLLVLLASEVSAASDENYIRLQITSRPQINKLTHIISIDGVVGDTVYAYASSEQLAELSTMGYSYVLLPHPSSLYVPPTAAAAFPGAWDTYPTYDQYVAWMQQNALAYPTLYHLDTIGTTVQGRLLLMATISNSVNSESAEPEVLYTSSMHGDEVLGYVLMLHFIDTLLTSYGQDSYLTGLVNGLKIYVCPLANPDGTYNGGNSTVAGATRGNGNGVDLNRNYPDPLDGPHPDLHDWQPETVAFMNFANTHSPILGANFHGGFEVVNYPWDCWVNRHADEAWFLLVSHQFADTCHQYGRYGYMTNWGSGVTDGYDWFQVDGGRQDYMNYFHGCREVTIEISGTKIMREDSLLDYWEYDRRSFFQFIEQALYGIQGRVTNSSNGEPLAATVHVMNHDIDHSEVYTDPTIGDYHRPIKAGSYNLQFSAVGFVTKTIYNVSIADRSTTALDVQLDPLPDIPALALTWQTADQFKGGDTVSFTISLVNNGGGAAQNARGRITTVDPKVSILVDTASYPTIPPLSGAGTSSSSYKFAVASDVTPGHEIPFTLYLNSDGGYSDSISFIATAGQRIESFETANFSSYPWQLSGNQPWTIDGTDAAIGTYSARSGHIGNSQSSVMQVTQTNLRPGNISFRVKTSSEGGFDLLQFSIDGSVVGTWSGDIAWTNVSFPVTGGAHTFTWSYSKDVSYQIGADAVWIDYIIFPFQSCCNGSTGNFDGDQNDVVDMSDVQACVDFLYFGVPLQGCFDECDVDRSGSIDISDLQMLIDFLFFSATLPACP